MARARYEVRGLNELIRTLRKAGVDISELKEANRDAAKSILPFAVSAAPVRTGALKTSVRVGATLRAGIIRAGNKTRIPYAGPIHWGWPKHNIKPNTFIVSQADTHEDVWLETYMEHIDKVLRKIEGTHHV